MPPLCPLAQSAYDYSRGADLIQRAQEHTTFVLTGMLKSMGFEKIDIVFQANTAAV